jgi:putative membrane protein
MAMAGAEVCGSSWWWIFPLVMMFLCFFMMRGRRGSMMCGFGARRPENSRSRINDSNSAIEILDKRYAFGDISKEEYEEKKSVLDQVLEK